MRALLILPALGSMVIAFTPRLAPAQGFEGQIVTQIFDKGKPSTELLAHYKGSKSRIEMGSGGQGYMLLNMADQVMYTVMTQQKMYLKFDLTDAAKDAQQGSKGDDHRPPKIEKTGKTETIAGHACEHYIMTQADGDVTDICAAKGIGFFGMVGKGTGPGGRPLPGSGAVPARYADLANTFKDGFQPLKVERIKGGNRELLMQVKSIEKKNVDQAMMEVPAGFSEFKMPGLGGLKLPKRP